MRIREAPDRALWRSACVAVAVMAPYARREDGVRTGGKSRGGGLKRAWWTRRPALTEARAMSDADARTGWEKRERERAGKEGGSTTRYRRDDGMPNVVILMLTTFAGRGRDRLCASIRWIRTNTMDVFERLLSHVEGHQYLDDEHLSRLKDYRYRAVDLSPISKHALRHCALLSSWSLVVC